MSSENKSDDTVQKMLFSEIYKIRKVANTYLTAANAIANFYDLIEDLREERDIGKGESIGEKIVQELGRFPFFPCPDESNPCMFAWMKENCPVKGKDYVDIYDCCWEDYPAVMDEEKGLPILLLCAVRSDEHTDSLIAKFVLLCRDEDEFEEAPDAPDREILRHAENFWKRYA